MTMCENCGTPYMDDRKKIIYQGMEFCDIECFLNSRYFDIESLDAVQAAKEEAKDALEDFKKSEDEKATVEVLNDSFTKKVEELLSEYDSHFETGNKLLDEVLLKLTAINEDCKK